MQLFISPGACSLAPHIALREAGADFEAVKVDLSTRKTEAGDDFLAVNPSGKVPALTLDNSHPWCPISLLQASPSRQRVAAA